MADKPEVVFVISPLQGDIEGNIEKASEYCRRIAIDGDIPIAPHVYTTRFLDDTNPFERELGIKIGHFMMRLCTQARTFEHALTPGMSGDVLEARDVVGIPVVTLSGEKMEPTCEPTQFGNQSRAELEQTAANLMTELATHIKTSTTKLTMLGKLTRELAENGGVWDRTLTEVELDLLHDYVKSRGDSSLLNWGAHLIQEQEKNQGGKDES